MVTRQAPRTRRGTEWFTTDRGFTALGSGSQDNVTLFNASLVGARFVKGTTITRMLIDFIVKNDAIAQTNILYWGIVTMNADARAAGAFPDPLDVSDRAGWMVRGKILTNADSLSDSSQWARKTLDIRSQRILHTEEDELQLILESSGTGFTLQWATYIRTLVKWA